LQPRAATERGFSDPDHLAQLSPPRLGLLQKFGALAQTHADNFPLDIELRKTLQKIAMLLVPFSQ
jgi:hypothetical protein